MRQREACRDNPAADTSRMMYLTAIARQADGGVKVAVAVRFIVHGQEKYR